MCRITTHSEVGGHAVNEDAFEVMDEGADALCVLADGQGGQPGGQRAARLACDRVIELARQTPVKKLEDLGAWVTLLRRADQALEGPGDVGRRLEVCRS